MLKLRMLLLSTLGVSFAYAVGNPNGLENQNNTSTLNQSESTSVTSLYNKESAILPGTKISESELEAAIKKAEFDQYTGVLGTAPKHVTVTSSGISVEQSPSGAQSYLFFTQTLSNGFYYEGRIYGKYNYDSQNPVFPNVPVSSENNPMGYGAAVKVGYNFHAGDKFDITPYLRLNAYNNISVAYNDANGDFINSTTYAVLPGFKMTFKTLPVFTPYIDIYGGYQQVNLNGTLTQGNFANIGLDGNVGQWATTTEFGFAYKVSNTLAVIPYMQYINTANNPNGDAAKSYTDGGFNISELTSSQQVFGLKLSASW